MRWEVFFCVRIHVYNIPLSLYEIALKYFFGIYNQNVFNTGIW